MFTKNFNKTGGYARGINLQSEEAITLATSDSATFEPASLYIGTGGDLKVVDSSGNTTIFANVPGGTILPVLVTQVFATGTTASDLISLR
jgi:hypothetical protein